MFMPERDALSLSHKVRIPLADRQDGVGSMFEERPQYRVIMAMLMEL